MAPAVTSARQIEANRRNALGSIGPKTDLGKQRASQNAVRHGLCKSRAAARPSYCLPRGDRATIRLHFAGFHKVAQKTAKSSYGEYLMSVFRSFVK
jgi:hypothetical protein